MQSNRVPNKDWLDTNHAIAMMRENVLEDLRHWTKCSGYEDAWTMSTQAQCNNGGRGSVFTIPIIEAIDPR
jgi:hypothetical protein